MLRPTQYFKVIAIDSRAHGKSIDTTTRELSYEQMAGELGIGVRALRELVRKRVIPVLRLGHRSAKFQRSRVIKALAKREVREIG